MSVGLAGQNLIFLISQPRAGSTLLQRMLGAHPDVHTTSEPWIALHPVMALRDGGMSAVYDHGLARSATLDFLSGLPHGEATYVDAVRQMLLVLYDAALDSSGKRVFLDKTPRYYFIVSELARIFPGARFVLLIRNPLAVLSSILETWVRTPSASGLNGFWHDLLTAPRHLVDGAVALGGAATVVRYESLVRTPDVEMRRLCDRLGIAFLPEMVEYGSDADAARWALGDQGLVYDERWPVGGRVDRWSEVLRRFPNWHALGHVYLECLGASLCHRLGYETTALAAALGEIDDAQARAFAADILAAPPDPGTFHRAAELAHRRSDQLEAIAAERLAVMEEQTRAVAAFQAALAGRDADLQSLRADLVERSKALDEATRRVRSLEALQAAAHEGTDDHAGPTTQHLSDSARPVRD